MHGLQPSDSPTWILERLAGESRDVLIVGHMPSLPRLLRAVVAGDEQAALSFPVHGVVALEAAGDGVFVEGWRLEEPAQASML